MSKISVKNIASVAIPVGLVLGFWWLDTNPRRFEGAAVMTVNHAPPLEPVDYPPRTTYPSAANIPHDYMQSIAEIFVRETQCSDLRDKDFYEAGFHVTVHTQKIAPGFREANVIFRKGDDSWGLITQCMP